MVAKHGFTAFADNIGTDTDLDTTRKDLEDFGFTTAEVARARRVMVSTSAAIRFAYLASTPVASGAGHIVAANGTIVFDDQTNFADLGFVADAADAVVTITLFE